MHIKFLISIFIVIGKLPLITKIKLQKWRPLNTCMRYPTFGFWVTKISEIKTASRGAAHVRLFW